MKMKISIIGIVLQVFCIQLTFAQVKFRFSYGIYDQALKKQVENNVSALLMEINRADSCNDLLNLAKIKMTKGASERLSMLWHNMPFRCEWKYNVQSSAKDFTGYEIRQIPVILKTLDNTYKEEHHKELTISFDKQGVLTSVTTSIDNNSYLAALLGGKGNPDMRMRREILKYIENYRSCYIEKNIDAIEKMIDVCFLDVKTSLNENNDTTINLSLKKNERLESDKQFFLRNLNKLFQQKSYVDARVSEIELLRHGSNSQYYGTRFRLQLYSGDEEQHNATDGYYFLLWDFTEDANPQIHYCLLFPKKEKYLRPEDFYLPSFYYR